MLDNVSTGAGHTYPIFTTFNPREISLQGLSTSYCMYMKLNTQNKYHTNCNDDIVSIFVPGAQTWFRTFKAFGGRIIH